MQIRGKLVKMIKNADSKFDDYSILNIGVKNQLKKIFILIRQINV